MSGCIQSSGFQEPEQTTDELRIYKFKEPFVVGSFQYNFITGSLKKEIGQQIMDNFMGSKADGIYVILEVEVTNVGKKTEYLTSSNIKIIDGQDREFDPDFSAGMYLTMDPAFKGAESLNFDNLNPSLTKKGYIVFDIPNDNNFRGILRVTDNSILSSETAWVKFEELK